MVVCQAVFQNVLAAAEFVISFETKQVQSLLVKVGVAAPQTKPAAFELWDWPKKTTSIIIKK